MNSRQPKHNRQSNRLTGYDYGSEGLYFVTIVCNQRKHLFGEIIDQQVRLNEAGQEVQSCWLAIPNHFPFVKLHPYVIMPNHVHGIIEISNSSGKARSQEEGMFLPNNPFGPGRRETVVSFQSPSKTVGSIVRGFKVGVTKWMRQNTKSHYIWQRNYYDHIIRDGNDYQRIVEYIEDNPRLWDEDPENQ